MFEVSGVWSSLRKTAALYAVASGWPFGMVGRGRIGTAASRPCWRWPALRRAGGGGYCLLITEVNDRELRALSHMTCISRFCYRLRILEPYTCYMYICIYTTSLLVYCATTNIELRDTLALPPSKMKTWRVAVPSNEA